MPISAAIHLGASVTQIAETEDGVVVGLVDGRSVAGSLLVGADGVHSITRSALFGAAKARFTGCMAWRGVVPMERLPPHLARQAGVNWIGPGRHVVTYPLRGGKLIELRRRRRAFRLDHRILDRARNARRMRARFRRLAPGRPCADRQYRRPLSLGAVEPRDDRTLDWCADRALG